VSVDIGEIVDHHCFSYIFIIQLYSWSTTSRFK